MIICIPNSNKPKPKRECRTMCGPPEARECRSAGRNKRSKDRVYSQEARSSSRSWNYRVTGKTHWKSDSSKRMTYYFCFMNERLGLCYMRIPTWRSFRLQFYFNGHSCWPAHRKNEGSLTKYWIMSRISFLVTNEKLAGPAPIHEEV